MKRRQTSLPRQWFIVDRGSGVDTRSALCHLRRGTGVLVLKGAASVEHRRIATSRKLRVVGEAEGVAVRVHNLPELRRALLRRTSLILLSPIYPTASHPDWVPLPRMRAAAFARLAGRRLIAIGGMDAKRFGRVERLGFQGWAGISAFRT